MKANVVLEGAALCSPLRQGQLDNLCGLYASMNALSVVCAPLTPFTARQQNELFREGLAWLERRASLAEVLSYGMVYDLHIGLTKALCKETQARCGVEVAVGMPDGPATSLTPKHIHRFIDQALAEKAAVVVCLEHTLDHYSVIVGAGAGRYQLHDSTGLQWLHLQLESAPPRHRCRAFCTERQNASCARPACPQTSG